LADPAAEVTEWLLTYADLSNEEAEALRTFFDAMEGTLNGFTFLDPAGNLLAWSGQLDNAAWQADPLLNLTEAISDPLGTSRAWRLTNNGGAEQAAGQTLAAAGEYQYCLSAYVRSATATNVTLAIGGRAVQRPVTTQWTRIAWTCNADAEETSVRFAIGIGAGDAVDVYGLQAEAQAAPSTYKESTRGGVYGNAHLADDVLAVTTTDVNRHSCKLKVIHENHL
jgi:hypothetical protein